MGAKRIVIGFLVLALGVAGAGCEAEDGSRGTTDAETSGSSEPPPVHFYREYVTIEPSERACRVDGLYFLRSVADRPLELGIEYPFPVGARSTFPYNIRLYDVTDEGERAIGYVTEDTSIRFRMRFEPEEERTFRVRYAQQIRGGSATYIVTTTRLWERPIELAEFEIRIPPELEDVTLSIGPDSTWTRGDTTVHYVRETAFYPDEDILISWSD
ncbi:MAG: hypothetical protein GF405_09500 [Candidatus Eisenbacteria bacterium]|nr:hypothetical protein [Candidatus Eisenbacteria bacterium]